jgi:hypothetical protein
VTPVRLDKLENAIIKPGLDEKLTPLLNYKGGMGLGRAHRLLNLCIAAMEQDCAFSDVTQRLQHNEVFSHLCGPEKPVRDAVTLYSFFGRLVQNPDVTNNIPHLLDYVRSIGGRKIFSLEQLPNECRDRRSAANKPWRTYIGPVKNPRKIIDGRGGLRGSPLVYPFLVHDGGRPEHVLLRKVNAAIPRHFSPDLRADMCQDLIVGILCGDFSEDDLLLPAKEMTRKVLKMFPTKYGPLSLDAEIPGTDGFRLIDTISDEMNPWELMETM